MTHPRTSRSRSYGGARARRGAPMRREWGAGPRQLPVRACLLVVCGGVQERKGGPTQVLQCDLVIYVTSLYFTLLSLSSHPRNRTLPNRAQRPRTTPSRGVTLSRITHHAPRITDPGVQSPKVPYRRTPRLGGRRCLEEFNRQKYPTAGKLERSGHQRN